MDKMMGLFTGEAYTQATTHDFESNDQLFEAIHDSFKDGQPVTLSFKNPHGPFGWFKVDEDPNGLAVSQHAYSVVGVEHNRRWRTNRHFA